MRSRACAACRLPTSWSGCATVMPPSCSANQLPGRRSEEMGLEAEACLEPRSAQWVTNVLCKRVELPGGLQAQMAGDLASGAASHTVHLSAGAKTRAGALANTVR